MSAVPTGCTVDEAGALGTASALPGITALKSNLQRDFDQPLRQAVPVVINRRAPGTITLAADSNFQLCHRCIKANSGGGKKHPHLLTGSLGRVRGRYLHTYLGSAFFFFFLFALHSPQNFSILLLLLLPFISGRRRGYGYG